MNYNIYELSGKEKKMLWTVLIAGLFLAGSLFFKSLLPVILFPAIKRRCQQVYADFLMEKRKKQLLFQFRDLLYELASSFSTGMHMAEAIKESAQKLKSIYGGDSYIVTELSLMTEKIAAGETDISVWEDFSKRSGLEDVSDFVLVFRVCRETGGDFISVLNDAAYLTGEKILLENDIKTMMVQKKYEGYIITLMPFFILLFLRVTSPGYLDPVYTTTAGRIIMMAALLLIISAYGIIRKIVMVEI